jgi:hypothetical protein
MNAEIIYKQSVKDSVLDGLVKELPIIIAETMAVPGGNLARLKPEQIMLAFSQANPRDVGSDIRIIVFAKNNDPRISTEDDRAKTILDRVITLTREFGEDYSVDIRLYLLEIGAAEHARAVRGEQSRV